jgi:very-short-patch-repair endonuclease
MNYSDAVILARHLRKNQTSQEKKLWEKLRNRNLDGYKFSRQKPIKYESVNFKNRFFIVDFYCAQFKLIVEVDGTYHDFYKEYDKEREEIISLYGYEIIRILNFDVDQNLESVLSKIRDKIKNKIRNP